MGWGLEKGSVDRGDAIENAKLVGKINSFRKWEKFGMRGRSMSR